MKHGFELVTSSAAVICQTSAWFLHIDETSLSMSYILSYDDFWPIWKSKPKVFTLCGMFSYFLRGLIQRQKIIFVKEILKVINEGILDKNSRLRKLDKTDYDNI